MFKFVIAVSIIKHRPREYCMSVVQTTLLFTAPRPQKERTRSRLSFLSIIRGFLRRSLKANDYSAAAELLPSLFATTSAIFELRGALCRKRFFDLFNPFGTAPRDNPKVHPTPPAHLIDFQRRRSGRPYYSGDANAEVAKRRC